MTPFRLQAGPEQPNQQRSTGGRRWSHRCSLLDRWETAAEGSVQAIADGGCRLHAGTQPLLKIDCTMFRVILCLVNPHFVIMSHSCRRVPAKHLNSWQNTSRRFPRNVSCSVLDNRRHVRSFPWSAALCRNGAALYGGAGPP